MVKSDNYFYICAMIEDLPFEVRNEISIRTSILISELPTQLKQELQEGTKLYKGLVHRHVQERMQDLALDRETTDKITNTIFDAITGKYGHKLQNIEQQSSAHMETEDEES